MVEEIYLSIGDNKASIKQNSNGTWICNELTQSCKNLKRAEMNLLERGLQMNLILKELNEDMIQKNKQLEKKFKKDRPKKTGVKKGSPKKIKTKKE